MRARPITQRSRQLFCAKIHFDSSLFLSPPLPSAFLSHVSHVSLLDANSSTRRISREAPSYSSRTTQTGREKENATPLRGIVPWGSTGCFCVLSRASASRPLLLSRSFTSRLSFLFLISFMSLRLNVREMKYPRLNASPSVFLTRDSEPIHLYNRRE